MVQIKEYSLNVRNIAIVNLTKTPINLEIWFCDKCKTLVTYKTSKRNKPVGICPKCGNSLDFYKIL